jgi:transcriptional regulator with XRE-family HTH domain
MCCANLSLTTQNVQKGGYTLKEIIAKRLVQLRGDMPREKVADALNISVSALQMYENGQRIPRDEIKLRIASFYNKTVQEIFFDDIPHETCGGNQPPAREVG